MSAAPVFASVSTRLLVSLCFSSFPLSPCTPSHPPLTLAPPLSNVPPCVCPQRRGHSRTGGCLSPRRPPLARSADGRPARLAETAQRRTEPWRRRRPSPRRLQQRRQLLVQQHRQLAARLSGEHHHTQHERRSVDVDGATGGRVQ